MSSLIHDVQQHYSGADVVSFAFDYETVRLDKGDIKKKTSSTTTAMPVAM